MSVPEGWVEEDLDSVGSAATAAVGSPPSLAVAAPRNTAVASLAWLRVARKMTSSGYHVKRMFS